MMYGGFEPPLKWAHRACLIVGLNLIINHFAKEVSMPRLHFVKKARKDNPVAKAGESYYWWQHAFSRISYSKERPKPSQMTQSEFMSEYLSMGEDFEEAVNGAVSMEELDDARRELIERAEQLRDDTEEKLGNMPDSLQEADTGQMMQERIDGLDGWISDLEAVDLDELGPDEDDLDPEEDMDEALSNWLDEKKKELTGLDPGL
jgi:hypothetical protein